MTWAQNLGLRGCRACNQPDKGISSRRIRPKLSRNRSFAWPWLGHPKTERQTLEVQQHVRIPGPMPGACVLHASVLVFPCHVQPLWGGHVTKHRSSPLDRIPPPSYLPIQHAHRRMSVRCRPCLLQTQHSESGPFRVVHVSR